MNDSADQEKAEFALTLPGQVHYIEFKLLLKPHLFIDESAYHKFWKRAHHVAKQLGLGLSKPEKSGSLIREVVLYDTPHFKLYDAGFILRKRTFFKHGQPEPNFELTIRFRDSDPEAVAAVDMRPLLPCIHTIKFKEEILQLNDALGGARSLFVHGCELDTPNIILTQRFEVIAQVFPALQHARTANPKASLAVVNDVTVEETLVHLGELDFGSKLIAKASIALWRNRATGDDIIGEFGYQLKFDHPEDLRHKARDLAITFFKNLQQEAREWVQLGTTKTSLIYGMGHQSVRHHE